MEPVRWLWKPYLPKGKITMFDGHPGRAKSLVTICLAAYQVTGTPLPLPSDGQTSRKQPGVAPQNVVIVCTEDDWRDTVLPRLRASIELLKPDWSEAEIVAALRRVATLTVNKKQGKIVPFQIPRDIDRLAETIAGMRAVVVIIDPIMAYLGESVNPYIDASVRQGLAPLKELAEATGVAVVLVRHLIKDGKSQVESRGGGSLGGFLGLARGGWLAEYHPQHQEVLVLCQYKANLARRGESIEYWVEPVTFEADAGEIETARIRWGDFSSLNADDLIRPRDSRREAPLRDECVQQIEQLMDDRDPYPADEARRLLALDGHKSDSVIGAARDRLGVRSVRVREPKTGKTTGWAWTRKPADSEPET
jgi:hypothetical protein